MTYGNAKSLEPEVTSSSCNNALILTLCYNHVMSLLSCYSSHSQYQYIPAYRTALQSKNNLVG
jgi:hypothetical protein